MILFFYWLWLIRMIRINLLFNPLINPLINLNISIVRIDWSKEIIFEISQN